MYLQQVTRSRPFMKGHAGLVQFRQTQGGVRERWHSCLPAPERKDGLLHQRTLPLPAMSIQ